jgi:hypothetical protein
MQYKEWLDAKRTEWEAWPTTDLPPIEEMGLDINELESCLWDHVPSDASILDEGLGNGVDTYLESKGLDDYTVVAMNGWKELYESGASRESPYEPFTVWFPYGVAMVYSIDEGQMGVMGFFSWLLNQSDRDQVRVQLDELVLPRLAEVSEGVGLAVRSLLAVVYPEIAVRIEDQQDVEDPNEFPLAMIEWAVPLNWRKIVKI